jgi:hypothetical protein
VSLLTAASCARHNLGHVPAQSPTAHLRQASAVPHPTAAPARACDARRGNRILTPYSTRLDHDYGAPAYTICARNRGTGLTIQTAFVPTHSRQLACVCRLQVHQYEQAMTLRASLPITFTRPRHPHEHVGPWVSCTRLYLCFTRAPQLMKLLSGDPMLIVLRRSS